MNETDALKLATEKVAELARAAYDDFRVCEEETIAEDFGWVFFYQSRKYLETGETKYRLAGNGPIVVLYSGEVHCHGSWETIEEICSQYK